jgi:hypothetical protein
MESMRAERKIRICSLNDCMGTKQVLKMIAIYYLKEQYSVNVFFLAKSKGNLWDDLKDKVNLYYTHSNKERDGLVDVIRLHKVTNDIVNIMYQADMIRLFSELNMKGFPMQYVKRCFSVNPL